MCLQRRVWTLHEPDKFSINQFSKNVSLLYSLKTSRFSDIFRGHRSGTLVGNGFRTKFQQLFTKYSQINLILCDMFACDNK